MKTMTMRKFNAIKMRQFDNDYCKWIETGKGKLPEPADYFIYGKDDKPIQEGFISIQGKLFVIDKDKLKAQTALQSILINKGVKI